MKTAALFVMLSSATVLNQSFYKNDYKVNPGNPTQPIMAKPGELIVIQSGAKGEVAWLYDARDFGPKHVYQADNGQTLILTTIKSGTYSINMIAWDERKVSQILVIVSGKPPDPNPPDPNPPDDLTELEKTLKAAYKVDGASAALMGKLISIYDYAINETNNKSYAFLGQLVQAVLKKHRDELASTELVKVRNELAKYTAAILPTDLTKNLDSSLRSQVRSVFETIKKSLERIK